MIGLYLMATVLWLAWAMFVFYLGLARRNNWLLGISQGPAAVFVCLLLRLKYGIPSNYGGLDGTILGGVMCYGGLCASVCFVGFCAQQGILGLPRRHPRLPTIGLSAGVSAVLLGIIMSTPIARAVSLPVLEPGKLSCFALNCAGLYDNLIDKILCCHKFCEGVDEAKCQQEAFEEPAMSQTEKIAAIAGLAASARAGNPVAVEAMGDVDKLRDPLVRLYAQNLAAAALPMKNPARP